MIGQFPFKLISVTCFSISAVFVYGGYKIIGVLFIIIYLCSFEPYIIHSDLFGQLLHFFNLVLIWLYNQELEYNKWRFTFQLLFPSNDILCAFYYFLQIATNAVLLIYL